MLTPAVKKLDCAVRVITPENIEFEYALAGPFQRLPAFLFDVALRAVAYVVLLLTISFLFSWVALGLVATFVAASLLYFFLSWFYGAYFESQFNGRTPGKMIFRLRVIAVDGRPINAPQALLRNLLRFADMGVFVSLQALYADIPAYFIPVFSIGLLAMTFTSRYQRLGDLAAGTMVICEHPQRSGWNIQPDDIRAFGLAELIPATFPISNSLAKTVGMYMENRQRLYPARRLEIAKHLADPLIERFEMLPDTSPDLLLCALYVRVYLSEEQRSAGLEEMRRRAGPNGQRRATASSARPLTAPTMVNRAAASVVEQPQPTEPPVIEAVVLDVDEKGQAATTHAPVANVASGRPAESKAVEPEGIRPHE
jgi:uncharacterized RDD family membrane protein YckC